MRVPAQALAWDSASEEAQALSLWTRYAECQANMHSRHIQQKPRLGPTGVTPPPLPPGCLPPEAQNTRGSPREHATHALTVNTDQRPSPEYPEQPRDFPDGGTSPGGPRVLPGLSQGTAKCSPHTCECWTPPASPSSPPHHYLLPTATLKTALQSAPSTTISLIQSLAWSTPETS